MEYDFYFPKTKSKHMATPVKGKVYPSKGGTVRYGIQATMNGSMSLPKYIKEEEFNRLGFGAESPLKPQVDLASQIRISRPNRCMIIDNAYAIMKT